MGLFTGKETERSALLLVAYSETNMSGNWLQLRGCTLTHPHTPAREGGRGAEHTHSCHGVIAPPTWIPVAKSCIHDTRAKYVDSRLHIEQRETKRGGEERHRYATRCRPKA